MKIQTKANINFHKLREDDLKNSISHLMNECADAAKARILEGFEREFDINGIGFEKNAYKYSQTKTNPATQFLLNKDNVIHDNILSWQYGSVR